MVKLRKPASTMAATKDITSKVVLVKFEQSRKDLLQYVNSLLKLENKGNIQTRAGVMEGLKEKAKVHDNFNDPIEELE
ncbi:MAG: hypothetical protein ACI8WW_001528 [Oceanospirillaceae bacterium]|jgi:hypothetical protein